MLRILYGKAKPLGFGPLDNPAEKPGLVTRTKKGRLWPREAVTLFVTHADKLGLASIGTAVMLNEWFGQREGDMLRLSRNSYSGGVIRCTQSKTGARVALTISEVPELQRRLDWQLAKNDAEDCAATTLLVCELTGRPWQEDTFRHKFAEVRTTVIQQLPEAEGLWFMHLRHTAVTRLAEAGETAQSIRTITGHSPKQAATIIDRYLIPTEEMAAAALRRRREYEQSRNKKLDS